MSGEVGPLCAAESQSRAMERVSCVCIFERFQAYRGKHQLHLEYPTWVKKGDISVGRLKYSLFFSSYYRNPAQTNVYRNKGAHSR